MQVRATVMMCGPVWSMAIMYEHESSSGLHVNDLKASVTPSSSALVLDVSEFQCVSTLC